MLATELILRILDELSIPTSLFMGLESLPLNSNALQPQYAALSACSLVCKSWSPYAQGLLFRSVFIPNNKAFEFTTALSFLIDPVTPKHTWLASCVRLFIFNPRFQEVPEEVSDGLFRALHSMLNLRHLTVWGGICAFTDAQLETLREQAWPRINSLYANIDKFGSALSTRADPQTNIHRLVACLPTIQILEISAISPYNPLRPFEPPPCLPLLSLAFRIRRSIGIEQCAASLLRRPDDQYKGLECLHIGSILPLSLAEKASLLAAHGPTLRSLTMNIHGESGGLELCTRLQHLALSQYPSPEVLISIPRSLEGLHFPSGRTESMDGTVYFPDTTPLLQEIEKLPRLRELILSHFTDDSERPFGDLRALCMQRGIAWRTSESRYVSSFFHG